MSRGRPHLPPIDRFDGPNLFVETVARPERERTLVPERATLDASSERERLFDRPTVVGLPLAAGESIPPHSHPGDDIVCYLARGRLDVVLDGTSHRLEPMELLRFDGAREIAVEAVEDSLALLVLASETE